MKLVRKYAGTKLANNYRRIGVTNCPIPNYFWKLIYLLKIAFTSHGARTKRQRMWIFGFFYFPYLVAPLKIFFWAIHTYIAAFLRTTEM